MTDSKEQTAAEVRRLLRTAYLKQLKAHALYVVAFASWSVGILSIVTLSGSQILRWLQTGVWPPMAFASLGLVWLGEALKLEPLRQWAATPRSWLGLHQLLDGFSVGVALFLLGAMIGKVSSAFKEEFESEVRHLRHEALRLKAEETAESFNRL